MGRTAHSGADGGSRVRRGLQGDDAAGMSVDLQHRSAERQMLDAIGEAVVATDEAAEVVYCNRAAEQLYGVVGYEILGRPVRGLIAPDVADEAVAPLRASILVGQTWSGVVTARRGDGSTFPHQVTLSPRYDDAGRIVGMIGVGRDITEDVAAQARERASDERFRRVFDESPVAMAIVGLDLQLQRANAALERLLGYTAEELVGRTLESVTHPDDVHEDVEGMRRLLEGDAPTQQIQKRFIRQDGEIVVGRVTGTLVKDEDGTPLYGIGTVEDMTATLAAFGTIHDQKERLATTLDAAGVATWDLDLATMSQEVSDNYADILGIPFDEVPATFDEIVAMVHPDDQHLFLAPTPEPGAPDRFDVEFRITRPRGGAAWLGCKGSFVRDEAGEVVAIRGTMVNLTEQRDVEIRRVTAEQRYRQTIEAANDAFVGADAAGNVCEWNAAATRLFGWPAEEIRGRSLMAMLIPEDRREAYALGWQHWADLLGAGEALPERWEMTGCHRDGSTFPVEISLVDGVDGSNGNVRAFVRDISARRAQEERLAELAVTDALTGLPDRTVLLDRLSRGIAAVEVGQSCVSVLFVDVDRFKRVNDELGHDAGDQLLTSVAQRLRSAVRPTDTVARIGGDEFAVVCEDLVGPEAAAVVAERILAALAAPLPLGRHQHRVGVSVGVATAHDPGVRPEALLRDADQAMYRAKKAGGGNVAFAG